MARSFNDAVRLALKTRVLLALCPLGATPAHPAPPQLDHLFPAGARQGTRDAAVAASGKHEQWPVEVWTDAPEGALRFTADPEGQETGALRVTVADDCVSGAYLVRLFTDEGVSAPRIFVVGTLPEETENEPNDTFRTAQVLEKQPAARVINGKLEKREDVDCYAIELEAGQSLTARVAAYVLDSPVDPLLHVRGPEGYRMAFNHDAPGQLLDPRLAFTAPATGRYVLELLGFAHPPQANIRLTGSEATRYRLTVSTMPLGTHTLPLAVRRGSDRMVKVFGGGNERETHVAVAADFAGGQLQLPVPGFAEPVAIAVTDVPEQVEQEGATDALAIPGAVSGSLQEPGETDRYPVTVTKDAAIVVSVEAAALGSALDPVLAIEDAAGKEVATNDDAAKGFDPALEWTAPADGTFTLAIRSRFRKQAGPDYFYRLQCLPAIPATTVTAAADAITVQRGATAELTLNVTRLHGHATALAVAAEGLPEGITVSPAEIPADAKGEWKLTLTASAEAAPNCRPFRLVTRPAQIDAGGGPGTPVEFPLKGATSEAGDMLINSTSTLWLRIGIDGG